VAVQYGLEDLDASATISTFGTGANLNGATDNGLFRAAHLPGLIAPEGRSRATINCAIRIIRHPGAIQ